MDEPTKKKNAEAKEGLKALAGLGCVSLGCLGTVAGVIYVILWAVGAGWRAGFGG